MTSLYDHETLQPHCSFKSIVAICSLPNIKESWGRPTVAAIFFMHVVSRFALFVGPSQWCFQMLRSAALRRSLEDCQWIVLWTVLAQIVGNTYAGVHSNTFFLMVASQNWSWGYWEHKMVWGAPAGMSQPFMKKPQFVTMCHDRLWRFQVFDNHLHSIWSCWPHLSRLGRGPFSISWPGVQPLLVKQFIDKQCMWRS